MLDSPSEQCLSYSVSRALSAFYCGSACLGWIFALVTLSVWQLIKELLSLVFTAPAGSLLTYNLFSTNLVHACTYGLYKTHLSLAVMTGLSEPSPTRHLSGVKRPYNTQMLLFVYTENVDSHWRIENRFKFLLSRRRYTPDHYDTSHGFDHDLIPILTMEKSTKNQNLALSSVYKPRRAKVLPLFIAISTTEYKGYGNKEWT